MRLSLHHLLERVICLDPLLSGHRLQHSRIGFQPATDCFVSHVSAWGVRVARIGKHASLRVPTMGSRIHGGFALFATILVELASCTTPTPGPLLPNSNVVNQCYKTVSDACKTQGLLFTTGLIDGQARNSFVAELYDVFACFCPPAPHSQADHRHCRH